MCAHKYRFFCGGCVREIMPSVVEYQPEREREREREKEKSLSF